MSDSPFPADASRVAAAPPFYEVRDDRVHAVARLGEPQTRTDGAPKVQGSAPFAGDVALPGMVHAALVTSTVASGSITRIDRSAATACPGVLLILTHENVGEAIRPVDHLMQGGWANSSWRPLASRHVRYHGQIVALVVADTAEQARAAADAMRLSYAAAPPIASIDDPRSSPRPLRDIKAEHEDRRVGDLDAAIAGAAAVVDRRYSTPVQHHNPIELPGTTCAWDGDRLTVWEPTRFVVAAQHGLAAQLDLKPEQVRVISPFVGGHFGSKLALSQHTAICALAARRLGRPVRLEITRREQFTIANHRTDTRHHVRLAADGDGRLLGIGHDAATVSSHFDDFAMEGADVSTALYAAGAVASEERLGRVDRNTPGPMRAPPEVPFLFALESAMDELACALGLDPVELRRRNDADADPVTGRRFTTRPLMRCFDAAAAAFGWAERSPLPRATLRDGWWIGHGCAAAARPVKTGPAAIRVAQDAGGAVRIETAQHEIGNGLHTLLATFASERLNVPLDRVTVALGDTALPPGGISGGSSTTTSLAGALGEACAALLRQPGERAREVRLDWAPPGGGNAALAKLRDGHIAFATAPADRLAWTFGAHMVEVRVDAVTGELRVARHVGAFAAGRVLNPLAARSQFLGGMIWGQSSALLEATLVDPRSAAYANPSLADYHFPTAADVGEMQAIVVADDDPSLPEGVKGLGEIGIIGVAAAVANAVFNATGVRVRDLPIRLDAML